MTRFSIMACLTGLAGVTASVLCAGCDGPDVSPKLSPLAWPTTAAIPLVHAPIDYTAKVTIGAQTFAIVVDTGSATLLVAGSDCSECMNTAVSPLYTPGPTAKATGDSASASYLDNSTYSGEIYTDQIGFGAGTPQVPINIVSVSTEFFFFRDNSSQGLIGLGPPLSLDDHTTDFVTSADTTTASGQLAFELCADGGTLWLGDFDATHAAAAPQFTPLLDPTDAAPYYNVALDGMAIGNASIGSGSAAFDGAFVDTGTTQTNVPPAVYTALIAAVNADPGTVALFPGQQWSANAMAAQCFTGGTSAQVDAMLPAMSETFPDGNGGTFTISAPPTQSYLDDTGNGQFCLAISQGAAGAPTILGDTFMRGFVSVIDVTHKQVGFATDVGCAAAAAVSPPVWRPHGKREPHSLGDRAQRAARAH